MGKLIKGGPYSKPVKLEKYSITNRGSSDITPHHTRVKSAGKNVRAEDLTLSTKLPKK